MRDQRPILQIDMIIEGDCLKFKESEDAIKSEFMEYFRGIVTAFDKFTHPRYCKLIEEDYEDGST